MKDNIIRSKFIHQNGFPKPVGLVFILVVVSFFCFVQCVLANKSFRGGEKPVSEILADANSIEFEEALRLESWMMKVELLDIKNETATETGTLLSLVKFKRQHVIW